MCIDVTLFEIIGLPWQPAPLRYIIHDSLRVPVLLRPLIDAVAASVRLGACIGWCAELELCAVFFN
jgi:hypothetical protein